MNRQWWIVLHKELRDALRDRRSLRTIALMTLMYPVMMWTILNNNINKQERSESAQMRVGIVHAAQAPQLVARFGEAGIETENIDAADEAALRQRVADPRYAAILELSGDFAQRYTAQRPARVTLWHDSVRVKPAALERITAVLKAYGQEATVSRLTSQGVSLAHLKPLQVERFDTATPVTRAGRMIAVLFGLFLIGAFMFGMDIAIDSSAGERERRSLEILLAQPVRPLDLIVGKWLAAALFCAAGLALQFILGHCMLQVMPLENIGLSWQVAAHDLALFYLVALPLCLLAPAVQIAVALNSRTFKEAQASIMLVFLVAMVPTFMPTFEIELQNWWYRVPLLAEQTLLRDLMRDGAIDLRHALTAMGISLAGALACIAFAARRLGSERYVINV